MARQAARHGRLLAPSDPRFGTPGLLPDSATLDAVTREIGAERLRRRVSRGVAALARLAAADLAPATAPLELAVLPPPRPVESVSLARPEGPRDWVAPPPVGPVSPPSGRDVPWARSGSPAARLIEALSRFERRVLGLVADATPALAEAARQREARRLTLIHYHRLLVRELVGSLADPTALARALAAGLPAHAAMAAGAPGPFSPVAIEGLVVLDTLAIALGADDVEATTLPLGAVLLANAALGVPASVVASRRTRLARLVLDCGRQSVPSGQALATALGCDLLPPPAIARCWPQDLRARLDGFARSTPLPIYVLLEADLDGDGRLGPLGTRLLAEGLLGPLRDRFPERPIDPHARLEPAGLRERDGRAVIGLIDVLRFIGAAGVGD